MLEILCKITGLTDEQLKNLPKDYFPAVTGSIISFDAMNVDENGNLNMMIRRTADTENKDDKYKHFISQVTYKHFKELMQEMENIIGERGSQYSPEMMITYLGISETTYEEACDEYNKTINHDKVTGGFARLFCDYMVLQLGMYPIFLAVLICRKDRMRNAAELIYSKKKSSSRLVASRYLASITMVLLPVLLLSFESLVPLISFGAENAVQVDYFAYIKYILSCLPPKVMAICAARNFLLCSQTLRLPLPFNFFGGWLIKV